MTKDQLIKKVLDSAVSGSKKEAEDAIDEYANKFTKDFIIRISRNPITCYSQKFHGMEKQFFLGQDYIERLNDSLTPKK